MSQRDKLEQKLRRSPPPKDFTWEELVTLMRSHGFVESCGGGSHYLFYNEALKLSVRISKPHPDNVMRRYQIKDALEVIDLVQGSAKWTTNC